MEREREKDYDDDNQEEKETVLLRFLDEEDQRLLKKLPPPTFQAAFSCWQFPAKLDYYLLPHEEPSWQLGGLVW